MSLLLLSLLLACGGDDDTDASETDSETDTDTDTDTDSDTDADTDTDTDTDTEPDVYPAERGFAFDGAWYPVAVTQACGSNGTNLSTYSVGAREGSGEQAVLAWVFGAPPPPGGYSTSPYDGAAGAGEVDGVLTDLRDNKQWLTDGLAGSVTVYDAGDGAIDVVWHDVSLATVFGDVGSSAEGWVTCTAP